ncbi:4'-phosphopantetheinyl transferase family protein [Acidiferrobacter thiooxydans]|jgi:4'-phosphopantetheinyl transferase|uniref:Uncharacterized protein n=1 Tax=Acidiferrobacter thiooxydans TaxID=163359 RepID=A0A1C2FX84_9GAMM|nr:4'-phosphopantetheinyl transferase superfamily protein [Acidiferrobacter thiooxydans]MDA8190558.1 4'-phosphopantetheinyl transferase superfamily protein [Gammaproteobacteria bacterium]RCN56185.1 hypothetical protein C4900_10035 [Acidiferrobacter thiooxydans]UEN98524.1 4'-phosphopantetheinyl transferase superfamily protein [Acidiferrobacter thiooxydans]
MRCLRIVGLTSNGANSGQSTRYAIDLPGLAAGEVHTWLLAIDADADSTLLSAEERRRADEIRDDRHRQRFCSAHSAIRRLLAGYTGIAPADITFDYSRHGKPRLARSQTFLAIQFSVSHTHDRLLIGLSANGEVGIDIEFLRDDIDYLAIARRHFSASELRAILNRPKAMQAAAFFRCWTGKEAITKVRGQGLRCDLSKFRTLDDDASLRARVVAGTDTPHALRGCYRLHAVDTEPGYCASIAMLEATHGTAYPLRQFIGSAISV